MWQFLVAMVVMVTFYAELVLMLLAMFCMVVVDYQSSLFSLSRRRRRATAPSASPTIISVD